MCIKFRYERSQSIEWTVCEWTVFDESHRKYILLCFSFPTIALLHCGYYCISSLPAKSSHAFCHFRFSFGKIFLAKKREGIYFGYHFGTVIFNLWVGVCVSGLDWTERNDKRRVNLRSHLKWAENFLLNFVHRIYQQNFNQTLSMQKIGYDLPSSKLKNLFGVLFWL